MEYILSQLEKNRCMKLMMDESLNENWENGLRKEFVIEIHKMEIATQWIMNSVDLFRVRWNMIRKNTYPDNFRCT